MLHFKLSCQFLLITFKNKSQVLLPSERPFFRHLPENQVFFRIAGKFSGIFWVFWHSFFILFLHSWVLNQNLPQRSKKFTKFLSNSSGISVPYFFKYFVLLWIFCWNTFYLLFCFFTFYFSLSLIKFIFLCKSIKLISWSHNIMGIYDNDYQDPISRKQVEVVFFHL